MEARVIPAAVEIATVAKAHWNGPTRGVGTEDGVPCEVRNGMRVASLADAHPAVKPLTWYRSDVTVGSLRRLVALGLVEHRDNRTLHFTPAVLADLKTAGILDADGLPVTP